MWIQITEAEENTPGLLSKRQPWWVCGSRGPTRVFQSPQKGWEPAALVHPWAKELVLHSQALIKFQEGISVICTFQWVCYQPSGDRGVSERGRPSCSGECYKCLAPGWAPKMHPLQQNVLPEHSVWKWERTGGGLESPRCEPSLLGPILYETHDTSHPETGTAIALVPWWGKRLSERLGNSPQPVGEGRIHTQVSLTHPCSPSFLEMFSFLKYLEDI